MNNADNEIKEQGIKEYRSLLLLDEISKSNKVTQRDLSRNLGIALGLINSYLKNLVSKGYITIAHIPKKRYAYFLTHKGFAEKTRLTYAHLKNFTHLYRVARKDFRQLFQLLETLEIRTIAFCGVDEVAEIAYLSLKEADLELIGVMDDAKKGEPFFGLDIRPVKDARVLNPDLVVITSFQKGRVQASALEDAGVDKEKICDISEGDWFNRTNETLR